MWPFTKKAVEPIHLEALVAPPGSTVVLRSPRPLSPEQRADLRAYAMKRRNEVGVHIVLLDGEWEAVVIGAPE
ncbi:hypothetical protein [Variovorax sp. EBFNA2]|uniref:hypothetical protein n=1 Tax=Variovorax sp. EBFNA2 TaxID=3342097 RepID=UPI0029BFE672|nr:hypothetical protein [Variovorax boronicumulans]WPG35151.1 hypothetical protein RZE79_16800 [Variovorax boronicumulans]